MKLERSGNVMDIKGVVKTIDHSNQIIHELNNINDGSIVLRIHDSYILPSKVIGELLKLHSEGKNIVIYIKEPVLEEILTDLGLDKKLQIKML